MKGIASIEISDNEYYVLNALLSRPMHGYAIRSEIEKMTNGKKKLSFATLYDTLRMLLEKDFISPNGEATITNGRVRKSYGITGTGEQAVREKYRTIEFMRSVSRLRIA
jgi:PadR family transcriptional regulator, regulatory protein PadR